METLVLCAVLVSHTLISPSKEASTAGVQVTPGSGEHAAVCSGWPGRPLAAFDLVLLGRHRLHYMDGGGVLSVIESLDAV